MLKSFTAASCIAAAGIATALTVSSSPFTPEAHAQEAVDAFTVDAVHSSVYFELPYANGVAVAAGRFNEIAGTFNLNSENPSNSTLSFTINAASIDTNNESRDRHLRSPDFFNAGRFSSITFTADRFESSGGNTFKVTGDLTMLGETKTITVDVTKVGEGTGRSGEPVQGMSSVFTIQRSDFGMNYGIEAGSLGDDITVTVHAYGQKR